MPLSFHQKRGAIERGWGQAGSSYLNEKLSFEKDATVGTYFKTQAKKPPSSLIAYLAEVVKKP